MTIQAFFLLLILRGVQQNEGYCVEIDNMNTMVSTYGCDVSKTKNRSIDKHWSSVESCIDYLCRDGYLAILDETNDSGDMLIKVKHEGFHIIQYLAVRFCKTLTKSVVLPIIVSIITTLITIWINGKLGLLQLHS